MTEWHDFYTYLSSYPALVWDVPLLRNMTIAMLLGYIGQMVMTYKREKSQNYTFSGIYWELNWISYGIFYLIFGFHGYLIANDSGLVSEKSYAGVLGGMFFLFLFGAIAFFLHRLSHNLICWYLGTSLWPWNPFINKPDFDKIVARNQRENRKAWAIEERRKRSEGRRFSDD